MKKFINEILKAESMAVTTSKSNGYKAEGFFRIDDVEEFQDEVRVYSNNMEFIFSSDACINYDGEVWEIVYETESVYVTLAG